MDIILEKFVEAVDIALSKGFLLERSIFITEDSCDPLVAMTIAFGSVSKEDFLSLKERGGGCIVKDIIYPTITRLLGVSQSWVEGFWIGFDGAINQRPLWSVDKRIGHVMGGELYMHLHKSNKIRKQK